MMEFTHKNKHFYKPFISPFVQVQTLYNNRSKYTLFRSIFCLFTLSAKIKPYRKYATSCRSLNKGINRRNIIRNDKYMVNMISLRKHLHHNQ